MCYNSIMMTQEKAFAKLNISLDITNKRDDGYHDMIMVMQTVSLFDEISIEENGSGFFKTETGLSYLPNDDRNLGTKAAKAFYADAGIDGLGAEIKIKKTIPVGAGMAGGSADAAAVLRALNRMHGYPLDNDAILKTAARVGSDVAFCVLGGTALAKGRGEILESLPELPDCSILIAKPSFSVSTPELFAAVDKRKIKAHPDTAGIEQCLAESDIDGLCRRMFNVFEEVPDRRMRTVGEIKRKMLESGAKGAIMTGTGSAVFGIYDADAKLEQMRAELKKEYGFCVIARPVGRLLP